LSGTRDQRFCTACGRPLVEGAAFCMQCGMPVVSSAKPPRKSPYRIFKALVPVWLVLLVLAAGIGAGSGLLDAAIHSEDIAGTHAGDAIARYGEPPAYWLSDGPGTPGEKDYLRIEQWLYPDQGVILHFHDGRLLGEEEITFSEEVARTNVSPTSLSRWMRQSDVEGMLSEKGTLLAGVETPYDGLEAFAYPRNHLLIGYLDGMFFSAQTY